MYFGMADMYIKDKINGAAVFPDELPATVETGMGNIICFVASII